MGAAFFFSWMGALIAIVPVLVVTLLVLAFSKFIHKQSFKQNFIHLLPFLLFIPFYNFFASLFWGVFIEGPGKLYSYWDHLPTLGFTLVGYELPQICRLYQTGGGSCVSSNSGLLLRLDVIWLALVIAVFLATWLTCGLLFWKKDQKGVRQALVISVIYILLISIYGFYRSQNAI